MATSNADRQREFRQRQARRKADLFDAVAVLAEAKSLLALAAGPNSKNAGIWKRDVNVAAHRIAHAIRLLEQ